MFRKIFSLILALSFLTLPFAYSAEASEEEEEEDFPECSWNNPCSIDIIDGDLDDPDTNDTDESGSNVGFNIEDPNNSNVVRGHVLTWIGYNGCVSYDDCYYAYYYQATRDYFDKEGVGMQFSNITGMYNFRAALEDYGFGLSNVTVTNGPRTLGNDTRGDDDGIIEDGEDWEYDSETCIEWRIYSGAEYIVRVDGKPIISTNPERYVHYQDYSQMNGATDCDENDGDGDDNVTMWGVGDFSDMEIVADEDDDVAVALALAYHTDVGDHQVKYSYDSQTVHTKMDALIRSGDVEEEGSNWKEIALDYLEDESCSGSGCDYIQLGYFTINVTADYPVDCEFGDAENSPCNMVDEGEDCEDPHSGACFEAVLDFCEEDGGQACQEFLLDWYDSLLTFVCGSDWSLVPFRFVNDENWDCPLGADEQKYDDNGDPINWFDCADGNEVWIYQVNDDIWDCTNGEDEGVNPDDDYDGVLNNQDICPETDEDFEVDENGCAANQRDSDQDGLNDAEEEALGTNFSNFDTDGDGLSDGDEVNIHQTDPLDPDTDGDGLSDGDEVNLGTNPNSADSDNDGLNDNDEINLGTDPNLADTDGDGVDDASDAYPLNSDMWNLYNHPGPTPVAIGLENLDISNTWLTREEQGIYLHEPQEFNNDIFVRDIGDNVLYFYVGQNNFCQDLGNWRTSDIWDDYANANPESEQLGYGSQYPYYCFDPLDRYENRTTSEWNLTFYYNLNDIPDLDGDGFYDLSDAFPEDSSEFSDRDGDGVGDNSDAYPDDPDRTVNIPPCPQNSSGFPECSCDVGYSGNLVFDEVNGEQWEGVCEEDISPSNEEEQTPSEENNEDEQTDLNNTTP